MSSREKILAKLHSAQKPFPAAQALTEYLAVTPLAVEDKETLCARFIQEARNLACEVHTVEDARAAAQILLEILDGQKQILAWDFDQIPCLPLESVLHEADISVAAHDDPYSQFGITGAGAALAATGSLVMISGSGRHRTTSLLPPAHIAIITQDQIFPNMEAWLNRQRELDLAAFQQASNINIISGPSRTADIAMELILGMHGPKALHIIIIAN